MYRKFMRITLLIFLELSEAEGAFIFLFEEEFIRGFRVQRLFPASRRHQTGTAMSSRRKRCVKNLRCVCPSGNWYSFNTVSGAYCTPHPGLIGSAVDNLFFLSGNRIYISCISTKGIYTEIVDMYDIPTINTNPKPKK